MADFMNLFGAMNQTAQMFQQKQEREGKPPVEWEFSSDKDGQPKASFTMDAETAMNIHKAMENYGQIIASMQQEVGRIQQQEERQRRGLGPLMTVLSQVSGELAQDKRLPPVVSALGRANLALNPTPQQLQQQRLGIQSRLGDMSLQGAQMGMTQLREERMAGQAQASLEEKKSENRTRIFRELGLAAQKAELTDAGTVSQMLQDTGMAKAQADTQAKTLVGISTEKRRIDEQKAAAKTAADEAKAAQHEKEFNARMGVMLQGLGMKLSEKSQEEQNIEVAAQALAPMNKESLSAATAVSGMFGAGRLKIFARARELNPKFNWAQINRMIDMEKSFTVGKDGQQIQSFGTFLEHAGDLSDVYKRLKQTDIPILNKSWNWLRQNAGKPQVARVLAALDPVKKEFESFLLNNRAMYVVDRQTVDKIISDFQSPAQMFASVNQMGHTVKARYTELASRYKQTMGESLPDAHPFTDEAIEAAKKIGVTLPKGSVSADDPLGVLK